MDCDNLNKSDGEGEYKCLICGRVHDELPAIAFKTPYHYDVLSDQDKFEIAEISDDFCVIRHIDQTDRFIRTTLRIPINDACEDLDYGIWVSLSEKSFLEYQDEFKHNVEGKIYFGMICNQISDYEESTIGLHVNVVTRSEGMRPELELHQSDHKLVEDWVHGISIEEAKERVETATNNGT